MGIAVARQNEIELLDSGVPSVFCWTKMGSEAGQPLTDILRRKELERLAGDGVFCWGIGNSLGLAARSALEACPNGVEVLFSPMKSAAKASDVSPAEVSLWLTYLDQQGMYRELPEHMVITSRRHAPSGAIKAAHYALFCKSNTSIIRQRKCFEIDASRAVNYFSQGGLGASQVTAMVRYRPPSSGLVCKPYQIQFRATLYDAGFVKLGHPVNITGPLAKLYFDLTQAETRQQWKEICQKLKALARASGENVFSKVGKQPALF